MNGIKDIGVIVYSLTVVGAGWITNMNAYLLAISLLVAIALGMTRIYMACKKYRDKDD